MKENRGIAVLLAGLISVSLTSAAFQSADAAAVADKNAELQFDNMERNFWSLWNNPANGDIGKWEAENPYYVSMRVRKSHWNDLHRYELKQDYRLSIKWILSGTYPAGTVIYLRTAGFWGGMNYRIPIAVRYPDGSCELYQGVDEGFKIAYELVRNGEEAQALIDDLLDQGYHGVWRHMYADYWRNRYQFDYHFVDRDYSETHYAQMMLSLYVDIDSLELTGHSYYRSLYPKKGPK
ncbi:MAG: hypothetical protein ABII00_07435 [Elusimicrobiota bacterium]